MDEYYIEFMESQVSQPLLKGNKKYTKLFYKIFCCFINLSVIIVLYITSTPDMCSLVIAMFYFYYLRYYFLDYHTIYDQEQNNSIIMRRFEQF